MKINLQGKNIELTETIKDYVFKKVSTLEKLISNADAFINIEIGKITNHHKQGEIFIADFNLSFSDKKFHCVSKKEDLYASIDNAKEILEYQIIQAKEKGDTLFRRGARSIKKMMKGLSKRNPFTSKY